MTTSAFPMHLLRTLARVTAKVLLWLFVVVLSIVILWFAANRLLDEAPDPQRGAFLVSPTDQISDARNAAVGMLGLTAPAGSDFVQYGSTVKALYDAGAPSGRIQEMLHGPGTLALTVTSDQVTCWLDPGHPAFANFKDCLPFSDAPKVLKANGEALQRFRHLFAMGGYSGQGYLNSRPLFVLLRLSAADVHLALGEGRYEVAYQAWRDQLSFVRRNLRGPDTWVGKAVELVAFGMTFELIENLLRADPQLALRHRDELLELLRPEGMDAYNPEGIVRAEYVLFRNSLDRPPGEYPQDFAGRVDWLAFHFGQRNRILNRYYAFARDYAHLLRLPPGQLEAEASRLREKHAMASDVDAFLDPFGSVLLAVYIEGQLKATEMIKQMNIVEGRLRLATLLVRIMNEHIEDQDIPAFLAAAGPALSDPLSGQPMKWNQKERRIYFPPPEYPCEMNASVYLPPQSHAKATAPSNGRSGSCQ